MTVAFNTMVFALDVFGFSECGYVYDFLSGNHNYDLEESFCLTLRHSEEYFLFESEVDSLVNNIGVEYRSAFK